MADYIIKFLAGNLKGKVYKLAGEKIQIGRSNENDIILDDKSLSRNHCLLVLEKDRVFIKDLGSINGIYVNNLKTDKKELSHEDIIGLGESAFKFFIKGFQNSRKEQKQDLSSQLNNFEESKPKKGIKLKKISFSDKANKRRIVLYGSVGIFLVVIFLLTPDESSVKKTETVKNVTNKLLDEELSIEEDYSFENADSPNSENKNGYSKKELNLLEENANLSHDTGRLSDAIGKISELIKLDPENSLYKLKKNQWIKERFEMAYKYYEKATLANKSKYYSLAIENYNRVLGILPDSRHRLHILAKNGIVEAQRNLEKQ